MIVAAIVPSQVMCFAVSPCFRHTKGVHEPMHLVADLGTSNFYAGVIGSENVLHEPCVVAYEKWGQTIIGVEAHKMLGRNPDIIELIKPIDGGCIQHMDSVIEILKHCVRTLTPRRVSRKFELTLAIPSGLTKVEERALEEAGKSAGANRVQLLNATVAAAVAANLPIESPTGCLVVNLGAGVTEASLLSMRGVVSSHRMRRGGSMIDQAIVERAKKEHAFHIGSRTVEELKHEMCRDLESPGAEVRGRNLRTGLPDALFVPRKMIEEEIDAYCDSIVDLIGQALSSCPPELAGDVVERGVVLVGGGARMSQIEGKLVSRLNIPVVIPDEPELCVVKGLLRSRWIQNNRTSGSYFRKLVAPSQGAQDGH